MVEIMSGAEEIWMMMAERFNLLITLRSYPVGIPSLMVSTLPLAIPGGEPELLEISSVGGALLIAGLLSFLGLIVGALYFSMVARAAIDDEIKLAQRFREWPRVSIQVILLGLVLRPFGRKPSPATGRSFAIVVSVLDAQTTPK